jgi:hypothetical protein
VNPPVDVPSELIEVRPLEGPLAARCSNGRRWRRARTRPNTLRAQKADGAIFQAFCESRGEPYLPADPKTIRAFIEHEVKAGKKPATVKRYVATIARVHIAAGLLNPCSSEAVRLGLKKMGRETSARQDQAHPLGWKEIKEFIESAGERDCARIVKEPCCAWPMRRSRGAASSWRSKSGTSISIRMAPGRRSFGAARRMRRGRGGWRIYRGRR